MSSTAAHGARSDARGVVPPGGSAVGLRVATRHDEAGIRRCVDSAYAGYVAVMGQMPVMVLDDLVTLIAAGAIHVADDEGAVVGVLVAWVESDHLHIDNVAVEPGAQGRGIGCRLLELADDLARSHGRTEVRLMTSEAMVWNLGFYPRRGFLETRRVVERGYRQVHFSRPVVEL